jgi:hypothetical protein
VTLAELLASLGKPPHRVAGIPAGIISEDDFDVTDEAFAALAAFPDLARLALDMGEALRMLRNELWEQQERDAPPHGYKRKEALIGSADLVLARLDGIANKDKTT